MLTFWKVGSNREILKQASENNYEEFCSTRDSKNVAIRIC